jgi:hypothetical protein
MYSFNFLYSLALLNKPIIFICDNIEKDFKGFLCFPETIDQVNRIFEEIERNLSDKDTFIHISTLRFDNLSFLPQEYPPLSYSSIITHIDQYFWTHRDKQTIEIQFNSRSTIPISVSIFTAE